VGGRTRFTPLAIAIILMVVVAGSAPSPAQAQVQPVGSTFVVNGTVSATGTPVTRAFYTDVAWDSVSQVYLVVYSSTDGIVYGRFVSPEGVALGDRPFTIPDGSGATFANQPRVAFSPDAGNGQGGRGAFLVVWRDERPGVITAQAKMIAFKPDGRASTVKENFSISLPGETYQAKDSHAIAYSTQAQQFLVVYHSQQHGVMGQMVGLAGQHGFAFKIAGSSGAFDSVPSVAYNSANYEFYIVWHRESYATGEHQVLGRRFNPEISNWADTGIAIGNPVSIGGWLDVPEVGYDSLNDRYLVAWYQSTKATGVSVAAQYINADDTANGSQFTIAFSGDKDRMPLSFNAFSGTFLSTYVKWNLTPLPGQDDQDTDRIYGAEVAGPSLVAPEQEMLDSPHRCHTSSAATIPAKREWLVVGSEWYEWKYVYARRITSAALAGMSVIGVSPSSGALAGGTSVMISGTMFQAGATVTFDGIAATGVTFVNPSQIRAITPAHVAGAVTVTVTNPDAKRVSVPSGYTYKIPAPAAPTLIAPVGNIAIASTQPTYQWQAVATATDYYILVNNGNVLAGGWVTASDAGCAAGTGTCSGTSRVLSAGLTIWQVKGWSQAGTHGAWSAEASFTVGQVAPTPLAVPTLVAPIGNATVATTTPTYQWQAIAGATDYYIWVVNGGVVGGGWVTAAAAGCAAGTGTCSGTLPTALAIGQVRWEVKGWSAAAGHGPWSADGWFTVTTASSLTAPTLVSPIGSTTVATTNPTYRWQAVAGATDYYIWVVNGGTVGGGWVTAVQAGCAAGTGTCAATLPTALAIGQTRWEVKGWSAAAGHGPWSADGWFTVTTASSLTAPTLVSPIGSTTVATTNPTYRWQAVAGATDYYIWIVNGGAVGGGWVTAADAGCPAGTGTCAGTLPTTLAIGQTRWEVKGWSAAAGHGPWSTDGWFTVTTASSLTAPVLVAPIGNATVTTTQPTYQWQAVSGAEEYYIWVSNGGVVSGGWITAPAAGCGAGTGTCSGTLPSPVVSGQARWQVKAWSAAAGHGPWSADGWLTVAQP
jgi:hypothetical protein